MIENEKTGIKLPGLEISYPNTKKGVFSILIICITIILILSIIFVWATPKNLTEVGKIAESMQLNWYKVNVDGKSEKLSERTQIQFMTPSVESWNFHKTKYGFNKMGVNEKKEFDRMYKWEKEVTLNKIERFAEEIKRSGISTGYRYYKYNGGGISQEDIGLWWVITIDSNKTTKDFINLYLKFWSPPTGLYIEELKTSADIKSKD